MLITIVVVIVVIIVYAFLICLVHCMPYPSCSRFDHPFLVKCTSCEAPYFCSYYW